MHQRVFMKLDQEQIKIFINFIDLFRNVVRDKQCKFVASHLADGTTLIEHPLKPNGKIKISKIDFEALCRNRLFYGHYLESPHQMQFIIPLEAIAQYEMLKNKRIAPLQRIENETLDYIKSDIFINRYPKSYAKWQMAEELFLLETDNRNLTTIGHLCRESLQEFSDELLSHKSIKSEYSRSKIIAKIKCVLKLIDISSSSKSQFLNALLNYWGALSDLVQKQEHDNQKESEHLEIEDARRIIFHSAIVMYEIDKTVFT